MASHNLTKKFVEALTTTGKDQVYFDEKLRGFGVKVTAQGKKSFLIQTRLTTGKEIKAKIGDYPALTVDQAREEAKKKLGDIAKGIDPNAEKQKAKLESITLADAYMEFKATRSHKSHTIRDYDRALSALGWEATPWHTITGEAVLKKHKQLTENNGDAVANLNMRFLRSLLNFCIERYRTADDKPLMIENPVKRLSGTKAWNKIDRRTNHITPHELRSWFEAVNRLTEQTTRDYLVFVLLTGLRREEAASLLWKHVDLKNKTFTVLDTKNGSSHTLPLSDYLFDLLKRRDAEQGNAYVFHSEKSKSGHIVELKTAYNAVARRMMREQPITIHDLRRTFLTIAESLDIPAYALKRLANHKNSSDVTAGYLQLSPERLRDPMQKITDFVLKTVGIKNSAEVIPLKAASK